MTESFTPSAHCFPTVKHNMSVKAASLTDYSGGSRNEDSVTIVFVMVTVMYVSMTSRASSVIGRCPSLVVGVIFLDNYWIMEGTKWGSRNWRTRVVRGLWNNIRLLSRSLNGGREGRWIRGYYGWRPSCPMMMTMVSFFSEMYHWLLNSVESTDASFLKGCFSKFLKKGEFVLFVLQASVRFFFLSNDHLSEENEGCIVVSNVSSAGEQ